MPTQLSARLANYRPLVDQTFAHQVSAGLTSSSFDVEGQNLASGSGESRVGLDAAGVEEVRRIMWVFDAESVSSRKANAFLV